MTGNILGWLAFVAVTFLLGLVNMCFRTTTATIVTGLTTLAARPAVFNP